MAALYLCGCAHYDIPFNDVHEDFRPYVEYFDSKSKIKAWGVPIGYVDEIDGKYATCTIQGRYKWISVSKAEFKYLTENERLVLILHELGHCVLRMDHDDRLKDDGCEHSIMYPSLIYDYCFKRHRDHYIDEFFNRDINTWEI